MHLMGQIEPTAHPLDGEPKDIDERGGTRTKGLKGLKGLQRTSGSHTPHLLLPGVTRHHGVPRFIRTHPRTTVSILSPLSTAAFQAHLNTAATVTTAVTVTVTVTTTVTTGRRDREVIPRTLGGFHQPFPVPLDESLPGAAPHDHGVQGEPGKHRRQ